MGANVLGILNTVSLVRAGNYEDYQDITLDYSEIVVTGHNKYSMGEIQEMATGLLIDGLQEPLIVARVENAFYRGTAELPGLKY